MIEVLTTFHKAGWEQYGKRMVETFLQHWPNDVNIHLYCENVKTAIDDPRVVEHDIFETCPEIKDFLQQHNNEQNNGSGMVCVISSMTRSSSATRCLHSVIES